VLDVVASGSSRESPPPPEPSAPPPLGHRPDAARVRRLGVAHARPVGAAAVGHLERPLLQRAAGPDLEPLRSRGPERLNTTTSDHVSSTRWSGRGGRRAAADLLRERRLQRLLGRGGGRSQATRTASPRCAADPVPGRERLLVRGVHDHVGRLARREERHRRRRSRAPAQHQAVPQRNSRRPGPGSRAGPRRHGGRTPGAPRPRPPSRRRRPSRFRNVSRYVSNGVPQTSTHFGYPLPFPGGNLVLSFRYNENVDTLTQVGTRILGPYLRWNVSRNLWVESSYTYLEVSSRVQDSSSHVFNAAALAQAVTTRGAWGTTP